MNVLTAGAGDRADDFAWTLPGELVYLAMVCDRDRHPERANPCGCGRAFVGLATRKATTAAVVADLDVDPDRLTAAVYDCHEAAGWTTLGFTRADAGRLAAELAELAAAHPVGTVLRRNLDVVTAS